jgi:hypothetical protein
MWGFDVELGLIMGGLWSFSVEIVGVIVWEVLILLGLLGVRIGLIRWNWVWGVKLGSGLGGNVKMQDWDCETCKIEIIECV